MEAVGRWSHGRDASVFLVHPGLDVRQETLSARLLRASVNRSAVVKASFATAGCE